MTPIGLCADDYAISPGVDDGILALAGQGRITAFSCMTVSPRWPQAAARLKPLFGAVDIGLHFTLTQLTPLGATPSLAPDGRFPAMEQLYKQALLRRIDCDEVAAELERQIDAFVAQTGREPDFLDGHHHVHQLHGIREAVARIWRTHRYRGWIRNTATSPTRILMRGIAVPRAAVLAIVGRAARRVWEAAEIPTNMDFAGVRSFGETQPYRILMRGYLKNARANLLIMCHPGRQDDELARIDRLTKPRMDELAYLSGDDFPADLAAAGCELVRLSRVAGR